ncbi:MAG: DUF4838 domain-containing protein [Lachnospiraceae bacterium]|nr:DUF4838 domain-containing protein [Lachnospiraceae bacterium]
MNINIVIPYQNAKTQYKLWANEEDDVNFRVEKERATRCTICFAAVELENYLQKIGFQVSISEEYHDTSYNVELRLSVDLNAGDSTGKVTGEEFSFCSSEKGLVIEGTGRIGVLYGAYELLKAQGICWLNPWEEVLPIQMEQLRLPEEKYYKASFHIGRGFTNEGALKESKLLLLWMARNKMNLSSYHAQTAKFQQKLGMVFQQGGHIFEKILDPNNILPSGKTIWEEHPEWYGLPKNGSRKKEEAIYNQFCMSNDELLEFLSEKILQRLQMDWCHADIVHISGFDTWGNNCNCENCRKMGNGSDLNLHFMSFLRSYLDKAYTEGALDRRVTLCFTAYEGTANLKAPMHAIPENVRDSGDYILYCPIVRCFEHCMDDESCDYNHYYNMHLKGWSGISMGINEYYNVSKFEDLPFLFARTMPNDMRHYHSLGVKCMQYMHHPMINWGVKNLTQVLYAELCWDVEVNAKEVISRYFKARYGNHAKAMQKVYDLIEEAGKNCSSWRAWCQHSILSNLQNWDGGKPEKALYRDSHLGDNAVQIGLKAVGDYKAAIEILKVEMQKAEDAYIKNTQFVSGVAVNPTDTRFKSKPNVYGERIKEDLMSVIYGVDCMELLVRFVEYYEALQTEANSDAVFARITELVQKMSMYYVPLRYHTSEPELSCCDALTRCQLKDLYYRCKAKRDTPPKGADWRE